MTGKKKGRSSKRQAERQARARLRESLAPRLKRGALWQSGATVTPTLVLRLDCISPGAKCAYSVLLSFAWNDGSCYPGLTRLAKEIGCTEKTVLSYIAELQEVGLVAKKRRGLKLTNYYELPGSNVGKPRVRLPMKRSRKGKNYKSGSVNSTVLDRAKFTINVISDNESSEAVAHPKIAESDKNSSTQVDSAASSLFQENLIALERYGVGEPKRTAIARLGKMNPTLIKSWHAELQSRDPGTPVAPGLLISVLESGALPPRPKPRERDGEVNITAERIRRERGLQLDNNTRPS